MHLLLTNFKNLLACRNLMSLCACLSTAGVTLSFQSTKFQKRVCVLVDSWCHSSHEGHLHRACLSSCSVDVTGDRRGWQQGRSLAVALA